MKKLYTYFVLALLTLALVSATVSAKNDKEDKETTCGQGVGSIDCECQEYGFDFGIAKYSCDDNEYDLDESIAG